MPYLPPNQRLVLDPLIEELAAATKRIVRESGDEETAFAGILNYCCTKLALKTIPERRYYAMALVYGVFGTVAEEFYRRYVVPYENEQIEKQGDVY